MVVVSVSVSFPVFLVVVAGLADFVPKSEGPCWVLGDFFLLFFDVSFVGGAEEDGGRDEEVSLLSVSIRSSFLLLSSPDPLSGLSSSDESSSDMYLALFKHLKHDLGFSGLSGNS